MSIAYNNRTTSMILNCFSRGSIESRLHQCVMLRKVGVRSA